MSPLTPLPAPDVTNRLHVIETCPCGATYLSGQHRDPVIWTAWVGVHRAHGLWTEEDT